jgi:tetratricopeptide (TPR) repeat protein
VRQDLLDLALFWTDLQVSLAPDPEKHAARHQALQTLAEVEELFGPSAGLCHRRERYAAATGLKEVAREAARRRSGLKPHTAWEHFALGRSFLEAENARQAAAHFDSALALEPDHLWPNFYKGVCSCRLKDYPDAVAAFSVCIGLAPREARCYYNRGCAYEGCGQPERARRDYDRALQLEPTLAVAALNRGRLHFRQQRFPEALADLQRALDGGTDRAAVYYDIALVKLGQGDRAAALASLRAALHHDPAHADARKLRDGLQRSP